MPDTLTVTLAVADLAATEEFYAATLGLAVERFVPLPGHPPLLLLRRGDATLLFREDAVLEALHPAALQNLQRHPRGVGLSLELTLPDLSPARRRLARRGWRLLYELEDAEFDREEIWLHDPDGYLLVLGTAPGNR
jgi:catechol 2,3-dioxygenase-like lactoylglutathione lyase family enzyme